MKLTDKDLEKIKNRAMYELKQINGENVIVRAYTQAVCIWLKENGLLTEIPEYKPRELSINNRAED